MDRRSNAVTPTRLLGLVTNASGDISKIPAGKRWGFVRTPDGKDWFLAEKNVSGGKWPQEGEYVSFEPLIMNIPGKTDKALDAFVVNR